MKNKNILIIAIFASIFFSVFASQHAHAFYYNNAKDSLTRIKISTAASHLISFDLRNNEKVEIGYNLNIFFKRSGEGFNLHGESSTTADFDFNDGAERKIVSINGNCANFNGPNDIAINIDDPNGIISFTPCSAFLPSQTNAHINIKYGSAAIDDGFGVDRATNPITPGTYFINIGRNGQTGTNIAVTIISSDQFSISATVDPSITMLLNGNQSLSFGDFIGNEVRYATNNNTGSLIEPQNGQPMSISVGTNGQGGISIYMYDRGSGSESGLWSNEISEIIPAVPANEVVVNSKSYAVYGKNSVGLSISNLFDNNVLNGEGSIKNTAQMLANNDQPFASGIFDVTSKAATTNTTKVGHYTDIITFLCTAIY